MAAPGAVVLVDREHRDRRRLAAADRDQRDVRGRRGQGAPGRDVRGDHDDALDGLAPQALHRVADRRPAGPGHAADRDPVAGFARRVLDAVQRARRAVEVRLQRDHAQGAGPAGDQRPRGGVGPVPELLHGGEDPFAGLRAHRPALVDHARDGHVRDPGHAGDVGQARLPRPRERRPDLLPRLRPVHHPGPLHLTLRHHPRDGTAEGAATGGRRARQDQPSGPDSAFTPPSRSATPSPSWCRRAAR